MKLVFLLHSELKSWVVSQFYFYFKARFFFFTFFKQRFVWMLNVKNIKRFFFVHENIKKITFKSIIH